MNCREQPGVAAWKQRWGWAGSAAATLASKQGFSTASGTRSTLCSVKQEDPRKANRAALAAKRNYSWAASAGAAAPRSPKGPCRAHRAQDQLPPAPPGPRLPPGPTRVGSIRRLGRARVVRSGAGGRLRGPAEGRGCPAQPRRAPGSRSSSGAPSAAGTCRPGGRLL